jgi:hypothetical protein
MLHGASWLGMVPLAGPGAGWAWPVSPSQQSWGLCPSGAGLAVTQGVRHLELGKAFPTLQEFAPCSCENNKVPAELGGKAEFRKCTGRTCRRSERPGRIGSGTGGPGGRSVAMMDPPREGAVG